MRVAGLLYTADTLRAVAAAAAHVRERVRMAGSLKAVWGCGDARGKLAADGVAPCTPGPGTLGAAVVSVARAQERVVCLVCPS